MNIWESTVLTDKGTSLQAKLVNGQTLHVTKVMTGGAKVPVVNLRQQTSVTDGGSEITLQPVRVERDKMILPVLLENTGLEEDYDLWQVGIYAQDPDEGEILYCIAQASEAKHIPSQTEGPGFSITWDFCFKTSSTAPFDVDLNSVGLVSIEQYQVHTGEIHSLKSSVVNLDGRIEDLKDYKYLGVIENYTITEKVYNNIDWNSYVFLIIAWGSYGNIHQTIFYPSDYLTQTSNTKRIIIGSDEVQIYRKDLTSLCVRATKTNSNNRVTLWGYLHK